MPAREKNVARVLDVLVGRPDGLTRAQIENAAGLSKPTALKILRQLETGGEIESVDIRHAGGPGGRSAPRWAVVGGRRGVVGLDLGHRHIRAAYAGASGAIEGQIQSQPADVDRMGPAVLEQAVDLISAALRSGGGSIEDLKAIGVGLPGPLTKDGRVASSDYLPNWTSADVAADLVGLLSKRAPPRGFRGRIVVDNDANVGALGEAGPDGAAAGCTDFLYLKVSSGIGMGLVLGGRQRIYRGAHGVAGEAGHVTVPAEAQALVAATSKISLPRAVCPRCKKLDCLENLASCSALVRQLQKTNAAYPADLDIDRVVRNAVEAGIKHPLCTQAVAQAGIRIGFVLSDIVRILDPKVVVIGGLLAKAGELLLQPIRESVERTAIGTNTIDVRLVDEDRIDRTEVEGAIALALLDRSKPAFASD